MSALPPRHQLVKEISLMLILKLLFLFFLWLLFFSKPAAKHLDDQHLVNHLINHPMTTGVTQ